VLKQDQGRDAIDCLLADGELDRAQGGRRQADCLIRHCRDDLARAAEVRVMHPQHPDMAHDILHNAVSNALAATLEAQGLRPGFYSGRRGAFEPAARQAVYDAACAQLVPPHGDLLELAGRMCREQTAHEYEYAPMPAITDDDLRAAAAIVDFAEHLLDDLGPF
jgi:hypothetical protein